MKKITIIMIIILLGSCAIIPKYELKLLEEKFETDAKRIELLTKLNDVNNKCIEVLKKHNTEQKEEIKKLKDIIRIKNETIKHCSKAQ